MIQEEDLPGTVGEILKKRLRLTAHQIRSAKFRKNGIRLDGYQVRVTEKGKKGSLLEVCLETEEEGSAHLLAVEGSLDILYEDADLIAVNKPSGVVVHPSHGHFKDTLANYLTDYFRKKGQQVKIRAVGRLDKDTSGIVVFAKNQVAAQRLKDSMKKEYLALVHGILKEKEGWIGKPIGKEEDALNRMKVQDKDPDGKWAATHYEVLKEWKGYSLLKLFLLTGRTHQIRVHMAFTGHPLLGDGVYGALRMEGNEAERADEMSKLPLMERTALHCAAVSFWHPFEKRELFLNAPLPDDMERIIKKWND